VSPEQRHSGQDKAILSARHALHQQAKARQPTRWSGKTRNWSHINAASLNPERDTMVRSVTQDD